MINDELGGLFAGDPNTPTPVSLRQGVVQSWDPDTGENSIQVAGGILVNLPALTSESASLAAGDVVALLTDGSKWLMVGKVTTPGDPGTVPSWVGDITALAPLTDLAAVTTGLVMTGATNATAAPGSGAFAVLNDPAYPGQAAFFSGNAGEEDPGLIIPALGGANYGKLEMRSPDLVGTGAYSYIELDGYEDGHSTMLARADEMEVSGGETTIYADGSVQIGGGGGGFVTVTGNDVTNADLTSGTNTFPSSLATLTGSQTLTNKDLSSSTNTFPVLAQWYGYLNSSPAAIVSTVNTNVSTWTVDGTPVGITHSAGVITVPTTGRYRITAQLTWPASNTTGSRITQVFTGSAGGSVLCAGSCTGNAGNIVTSTAVKTVRLTAADTFRVVANQGSGGNLTLVAGTQWSYLQVEYLGP